MKPIMMYLGSIDLRKTNVMKYSFLTSILLLTLSLYTSAALAENLVSNPDFETGNAVPVNWQFVTVDSNTPVWDSTSHSGEKSVKISISGTTNRISGYPRSDLIEVSPLSTYVVSAWGKTSSIGGTNTPAVRVVELDENKNFLKQTNLPVFKKGTNAWTQKTLQFTTEAASKYVYVYANIWKGYGTFWLDDVSMSLKTQMPNAVPNSGFEENSPVLLNWEIVTENANTPIVDSVAHTGSKSIKISNPGTTSAISGYPKSNIVEAQPLTDYTATAWGRTSGTGGYNTPTVRVVELDENKVLIRQNNIPVFGKGTNDWTQNILDFKTDVNTRYMYIYANIWNGYGTFWLDDVTLMVNTPTTPAPTTPAPTTPAPTTPAPTTPAPTTPAPTTPAPTTKEVTIAFMSDASISRYPGDAEYIKDLNGALASAPNKKIDAFVFPGDNDRVLKSIGLYEKSDLKDVPAFYAMGNHELSSGDYSVLKGLDKPLPVNPGPTGSEKTTYSFDIGRFHVIVADIYWNGVDKDYFKYGGSDGGYIHPKLMTWIDEDLKATKQPFKILVVHEPMYPDSRHVGNSLDKDKANRDQLQKVLEDNKASLVVAGHTHYGSLTKHGSIWHANDGTFGTHTHNNEKAATVIYAYDDGTNMSVIWKKENPTWASTKTVTQIITSSQATSPVPTAAPTPVPTPVTTTTPVTTATPTPVPTPVPTPSVSCYIVPGGVPSSMTKYVGKTACVNCHKPIPSTWKPCSSTPAPTPAQTPTPTPTPSPSPTSAPTPAVTPTPVPTTPPVPAGATIAYLGDARPSKFGTQGITELTKDLNQVVPQSPTGKVDAIFMIGDMDKISQTRKAYNASNVKDIPIYFVVGNHEVGTSGDVSNIRSMFSESKIPLNPGPLGTDRTTYSLDVGGIHVINSNQYWDGNNDGKCNWKSPGTTDASDDACNKYSSSDGGYIPDALYNWMNSDLSSTSSWKIVLGHEPMYPKSRHVGDSLDKDKANRDKLQKLFVDKNVSIFVGAHTHYATVNTVGGVYHVDAGISGQKTVDGEDPYASIFYTYTDGDKLVLTWKHENPTWTSPKVSTYTITR